VWLKQFSIIHAGKLHNDQATLCARMLHHSNATPIAADTSRVCLFGRHPGHCPSRKNICTRDRSQQQKKTAEQTRKSYPEAEKREGVDGGLNISNTCKRRSVKTLLVNGQRDLSIFTHDSPTSGWRGHSKNPRYPNPQVGQCSVYVATTLCHIVSVVYGCPTGGLNDAIENNHLGVLATAPWNARWH
jgi:hypothetical protein